VQEIKFRPALKQPNSLKQSASTRLAFFNFQTADELTSFIKLKTINASSEPLPQISSIEEG